MPFFKYDGVKLYYEISGSGDPLLLINGLAGDTRQWGPLIDEIKTSFQVISYDMRCAGQSDKPDKPFSLEDLTSEAYGLIRHLKHNKIQVLGFSMGGIVTMNLAQKHPDNINKIFLVSTTPSLKRPYPVSRENMEMLRRTEISNELLTKVYKSVFGSKYKETSSVDNFIKFRMNDDKAQAAFAYLQQLRSLESWDLYKEVRTISVPTIIVAGKEDKLIPPETPSGFTII
jgi:pimeloyl-ACP methyl ester carboxylesterase